MMELITVVFIVIALSAILVFGSLYLLVHFGFFDIKSDKGDHK